MCQDQFFLPRWTSGRSGGRAGGEILFLLVSARLSQCLPPRQEGEEATAGPDWLLTGCHSYRKWRQKWHGCLDSSLAFYLFLFSSSHFQLVLLPVFILLFSPSIIPVFSSHLDVRFSAFASLLLSCFFFFPPHVSSVLQHNELQHLQVCSQHLKILNELIERSLSLSVSFSLLFLSLISFRPSLPNFAAPGCRQQWLFFFLCVGISAPWELIR